MEDAAIQHGERYVLGNEEDGQHNGATSADRVIIDAQRGFGTRSPALRESGCDRDWGRIIWLQMIP